MPLTKLCYEMDQRNGLDSKESLQMGKLDEKEVERMEKNMLKQQKENPVSVDFYDNQTPTETQATEILVDEDEDLWIDLDDSEADEDFVVKSVPKKKKVV